MFKCFFLCFLILSLGHHKMQAQKANQEIGLAVYNVALGGITAGIGAVINKPKDVHWKKAFLTGLWQGSIGGGVNYLGKKSVYLIPKYNELSYAWSAKILHSIGNSIVENAALGEPFLQNWHIDYGIVRFDFSIKNKKMFKARLLPVGVFAIFWANQLGDFDFQKTLLTGNIIFTSKTNIVFEGRKADGVSYGRVVAIGAPCTSTYLDIAHEIIHQFQYNDYQVLGTWLRPLVRQNKSKFLQSLFSKYIYLDVPFFAIPYLLATPAKPFHYYRNFYEFEAQSFSTNMPVIR